MKIIKQGKKNKTGRLVTDDKYAQEFDPGTITRDEAFNYYWYWFCANEGYLYKGYRKQLPLVTDDIVQDAIYKLVKNADKIKDRVYTYNMFKGYLFIIVRNEYYNNLKKMSRKKEYEITEEVEQTLHYDHHAEEQDIRDRHLADITVDGIFNYLDLLVADSILDAYNVSLFKYYYKNIGGYKKLGVLAEVPLTTIYLKVVSIKEFLIKEKENGINFANFSNKRYI